MVEKGRRERKILINKAYLLFMRKVRKVIIDWPKGEVRYVTENGMTRISYKHNYIEFLPHNYRDGKDTGPPIYVNAILEDYNDEISEYLEDLEKEGKIDIEKEWLVYEIKKGETIRFSFERLEIHPLEGGIKDFIQKYTGRSSPWLMYEKEIDLLAKIPPSIMEIAVKKAIDLYEADEWDTFNKMLYAYHESQPGIGPLSKEEEELLEKHGIKEIVEKLFELIPWSACIVCGEILWELKYGNKNRIKSPKDVIDIALKGEASNLYCIIGPCLGLARYERYKELDRHVIVIDVRKDPTEKYGWEGIHPLDLQELGITRLLIYKKLMELGEEEIYEKAKRIFRPGALLYFLIEYIKWKEREKKEKKALPPSNLKKLLNFLDKDSN